LVCSTVALSTVLGVVVSLAAPPRAASAAPSSPPAKPQVLEAPTEAAALAAAESSGQRVEVTSARVHDDTLVDLKVDGEIITTTGGPPVLECHRPRMTAS
jgi:hypothetical protein